MKSLVLLIINKQLDHSIIVRSTSILCFVSKNYFSNVKEKRNCCDLIHLKVFDSVFTYNFHCLLEIFLA